MKCHSFHQLLAFPSFYFLFRNSKVIVIFFNFERFICMYVIWKSSIQTISLNKELWNYTILKNNSILLKRISLSNYITASGIIMTFSFKANLSIIFLLRKFPFLIDHTEFIYKKKSSWPIGICYRLPLRQRCCLQ